jgi:hypothetical protein
MLHLKRQCHEHDRRKAGILEPPGLLFVDGRDPTIKAAAAILVILLSTRSSQEECDTRSRPCETATSVEAGFSGRRIAKHLIESVKSNGTSGGVLRRAQSDARSRVAMIGSSRRSYQADGHVQSPRLKKMHTDS